jgi:hypothetical protein
MSAAKHDLVARLYARARAGTVEEFREALFGYVQHEQRGPETRRSLTRAEGFRDRTPVAYREASKHLRTNGFPATVEPGEVILMHASAIRQAEHDGLVSSIHPNKTYRLHKSLSEEHRHLIEHVWDAAFWTDTSAPAGRAAVTEVKERSPVELEPARFIEVFAPPAKRQPAEGHITVTPADDSSKHTPLHPIDVV